MLHPHPTDSVECGGYGQLGELCLICGWGAFGLTEIVHPGGCLIRFAAFETLMPGKFASWIAVRTVQEKVDVETLASQVVHLAVTADLPNCPAPTRAPNGCKGLPKRA
jgi:hypothetical protein